MRLSRIALPLVLIGLTGCPKPAGPPRTFDRPAFSFTYPADWTVDDKDKDYDPDHLFSIDASDGAMVMFVIYKPAIDPAGALATMVEEQEKRLNKPTKTDFKQWGPHTGVGTELRGKALSVVASTVRIFAFRKAGRTFVVTEYCPDDEKARLAPGYKLIQDSFQVKE